MSSTLNPAPKASHEAGSVDLALPSESVEMSQLPNSHEQAETQETAQLGNETIDTTASSSAQSQRAQLERGETAEVFLGPDGAAPSNAATETTDPMLRISLMLTTGARHPYTISNRYLTSRKVTAVDDAGNFDPRMMSAYQLKELIWMDWRPEWEPKPRDPSAIRLIIMGRMLEDKSQLKDLPFSLENTNVVHMTIKPADLLDDDAEAGGKTATKSLRGRGNSDGESAGCCRCVLQ